MYRSAYTYKCSKVRVLCIRIIGGHVHQTPAKTVVGQNEKHHFEDVIDGLQLRILQHKTELVQAPKG